ncbi:MAG: molybdenum cofactor biosynthesis protein MoaE [Desulfobacteraceae bacterium 4572_123]|nr:MAG: molybdenum cofactor biosynthesis protein MoaE [Desulfobacteraceae bacterium 4572_123]
MNSNSFIKTIKNHPEYDKVGMILCHNGVVRRTSRDGRQVSGLKIEVDHAKLATVIKENKKTPGIIEILVEIAEGIDLNVGDDVMMLVVAGDIRDNVINVLHKTLDTIKTTVTRKTQFYIE